MIMVLGWMLLATMSHDVSEDEAVLDPVFGENGGRRCNNPGAKAGNLLVAVGP